MLRFIAARGRYVDRLWVATSRRPPATLGEKEAWMAAKRVKRLKDLVDLLERLPSSPDRDRVLSEVRSRAVDLDTGVTPRAMLPVREPAPPVLPKLAKRDRARSITRTVVPVLPVVEPGGTRFASAASTDLEKAVCLDERLSLEDSPLPCVQVGDVRAVRPWTRGLRA
jgi:hypothetical protein